MSTIFKPHRGRSSVMSNQKKNIILEAGEMFIELPDSGTSNCKMKIGDGNTTYENLPYAISNSPSNIDVVLDRIYPIGSIYMSLSNTNPSTLFGGTWERIAQGRCLFGADDSSYIAGNTKDAGLPNITGTFNHASDTGTNPGPTGAFYAHYTSNTGTTGGSNSHYWQGVTMNANRSSSIYGNSSTVQPPALVVYMWKRTA